MCVYVQSGRIQFAQTVAYKVLALQVELCVPRLIAWCPRPRWRPSGLQGNHLMLRP
jgi:hypothetical protein